MVLALEARNLTKSFGEVRAVQNLDLEVEVGEIFGFLGPNGAGKSTTIKLFLDHLRPTNGQARVLGFDSRHDVIEVHRRVGYLPGDLFLPSEMRGSDYLDMLESLRGTADAGFRSDLITRFDLDVRRRLGELSTGNKRKVGLVQAFMHRPAVVLLDEPTAGLDPLVQHDFHEFLLDLAKSGTTVFLSSHALSEVDRIADRVGVIRNGSLIDVNTVAALKKRVRQTMSIEYVEPPSLDELKRAEGVHSVDLEGSVVTVTVEGSIDSLLRAAVGVGSVRSMHTPEVDLEDVFLDYYRDPPSTVGGGS